MLSELGLAATRAPALATATGPGLEAAMGPGSAKLSVPGSAMLSVLGSAVLSELGSEATTARAPAPAKEPGWAAWTAQERVVLTALELAAWSELRLEAVMVQNRDLGRVLRGPRRWVLSDFALALSRLWHGEPVGSRVGYLVG